MAQGNGSSFSSEWETFFTEVARVVASANNQRGLANEEFSEYVVEQLEMIIISVSTLNSYLGSHLPSSELGSEIAISNMCEELSSLLECLRCILSEWEEYLNHPFSCGNYSYSAPTRASSGPGRPRFDISEQQLMYLHSMGFTWVEIANLLGVSRMTIFRRRREFGQVERVGDNIDDGELELVVRQIRRSSPSLGQTMVWGTLRSMGYRVTRERVREAIRITDPINNALRWREVSARRTYSVPGPNSLWHIGKVKHTYCVTFTCAFGSYFWLSFDMYA